MKLYHCPGSPLDHYWSDDTLHVMESTQEDRAAAEEKICPLHR